MNIDRQEGKENCRLEYTSPKLELWGSVGDLTRTGGSGGPGDVCFGDPSKPPSNPDGSVDNNPHCEFGP